MKRFVLLVVVGFISCEAEAEDGGCSTWLTCFEGCKGVEVGSRPTTDGVVNCGERCAEEEGLPPLELNPSNCENPSGFVDSQPREYEPSYPRIVVLECEAVLVLEELQTERDEFRIGILSSKYSMNLEEALWERSQCVAENF